MSTTKRRSGLKLPDLTPDQLKLIDDTLMPLYRVGTRSGAVRAVLDHWERNKATADNDRATVRALVDIIARLGDAQEDAERADKATDQAMRDLVALGKSLRRRPNQLRLDIPS